MDLAAIRQAAAGAEDISALTLTLTKSELTDLHVDGDYAAYYFSGKDDTALSDAKHNFKKFIRDAIEVAGVGGRVIIHLTSGLSDKGGRFKIATVRGYQDQRAGSTKPKNWEGMRLWLESGKTLPGTDWRVVQWTDREADDGVSAAARFAIISGRWPAVLSRDKDFRMIAGRHVVWTTLERVEVQPTTFDLRGPDGEVYGQKWFWLQMLAGDTADNIPGLEKQPAKAAGTFKDCGMGCAESKLALARNNEDAYRTVRGLYEAFYGGSWPDRFVEQAALLWLRTDNKASVRDFLRTVPFKAPELEKALDKLERRIR